VTLSIMMLSIVTLSIMMLSIVTFTIIMLSRATLSALRSIVKLSRATFGILNGVAPFKIFQACNRKSTCFNIVLAERYSFCLPFDPLHTQAEMIQTGRQTDRHTNRQAGRQIEIER
jgi:hypothetical protein